MAAVFYLRRGDLQPYYKATLNYKSGSAINLTGATVKFSMYSIKRDQSIVTKTTSGVFVTDAANGQVEYRWPTSVSSAAVAGNYCVEFEITPSGGGDPFTLPAVPQDAIVSVTE